MNILNTQADFEVVGEANDGLEALIKARTLRPESILMDVTMPGSGGLEATQLIKREMPDVTIVMLTVSDEEEMLFEVIDTEPRGTIKKHSFERVVGNAAGGCARRGGDHTITGWTHSGRVSSGKPTREPGCAG